MVDGISSKPVGGSDYVAPASRAPAPAAPVAPVSTPETATPQIASLAKSVASAPPVDSDRVQRIKAAIANGTFPILPATIADQMMAFRYEWMSDDQA